MSTGSAVAPVARAGQRAPSPADGSRGLGRPARRVRELASEGRGGAGDHGGAGAVLSGRGGRLGGRLSQPRGSNIHTFIPNLESCDHPLMHFKNEWE